MRIDYTKPIAPIKPMNAVNNGPVYTKNADQNSGNLPEYKAARIPYARTHDSAFFNRYGAPNTVDVHMVFPNFDADVNDPASYDFTHTDMYMDAITAADTQVYYRLGASIEHQPKKYGTLVPKDFQKWAEICEHIIAHLNEGWADGHHFGIKYWEIWNEPDLFGKCWQGTPEQFYELYCVAAKHLKSRYPDLMIGGPAVTGTNEGWLRPFLKKVKEENAPMDFYSWHCYAREVKWVSQCANWHRNLLDEYGFSGIETHLNEWNYVRGWSGEDWTYTLQNECGIKGAAFIAAVMADCQNAPVDMLMYYDARPCAMNGLFDFYTKKPIKGYYAIYAWSDLADLGNQCELTGMPKDIFAVAAADAEGNGQTLISYFAEPDDALPYTFPVEIVGKDEVTVYLLDNDHNMTPVRRIATDAGKFTLTMEPNTALILK